MSDTFKKAHFIKWVKNHHWDNINREILLRHLRTYFDDEVIYPESESMRIICPECLEKTSQDELDMFGGFCEECSGAFDE